MLIATVCALTAVALYCRAARALARRRRLAAFEARWLAHRERLYRAAYAAAAPARA